MKQKIAFSQDELFYSGVPYFDNIEHLEEVFGIVFSCGDGFFYDDLNTQEQFEKYDGQVDPLLFKDSSGKTYTNCVLIFEYEPEKDNFNYEKNECYTKVNIKENIKHKLKM